MILRKTVKKCQLQGSRLLFPCKLQIFPDSNAYETPVTHAFPADAPISGSAGTG